MEWQLIKDAIYLHSFLYIIIFVYSLIINIFEQEKLIIINLNVISIQELINFILYEDISLSLVIF